MYTTGSISPFIIKVSLALGPAIIPLSKGVQVMGGSVTSATEPASCSDQDMMSEEEAWIMDLYSMSLTSSRSVLSSKPSVPLRVRTSESSLVTSEYGREVTAALSRCCRSFICIVPGVSCSPLLSHDREDVVPRLRMVPPEGSLTTCAFRKRSWLDCGGGTCAGYIVEKVTLLRDWWVIGWGLSFRVPICDAARFLTSFDMSGFHHHRYTISAAIVRSCCWYLLVRDIPAKRG